jgi:two-component system, cell cycle sensor histidine kinase PleC
LFWAHQRRTIRITERLDKLRLENELKWKADFTAMLVHDLRAPLNAVMGYAEMLKSRPEAGGIDRICGIIVVSCEKMLGLINDMLDFAKFEAGKMTIHKQDVAVLPLLSDAVDLLNPLFQQRQLEVVCDFPKDMALTVLPADQDKILQVMDNLLGNAAKFTPRNGKIKVMARFLDSELIEVSVEDNGSGVPVEQRQYLFQCFSQLNADKKIKGTGLGLAVSKYIIEMHGGMIGYRDAESGPGSVFYFTLPCPSSGEI